jgi:DNA-binding transcriptional LysR family regulator
MAAFFPGGRPANGSRETGASDGLLRDGPRQIAQRIGGDEGEACDVLRYAVAVAETGNGHRVAERLALALPPLGQRLHALERELGVAPLDRSRRRMRRLSANTLDNRFAPYASKALLPGERQELIDEVISREPLAAILPPRHPRAGQSSAPLQAQHGAGCESGANAPQPGRGAASFPAARSASPAWPSR